MTDFSAISELLRRAKLAQSLQNISGQPQGELPPETPVASPAMTINQPTQIRPAQAAYQEALKQPAPSMADYHPSLKRRIFGGLLGGIAGLHDPKTGYEVGRGITMGPFDRQMSDYQRQLAQKKEAFETEMGAGKESALEAELTERRGAEHARAGAEEARRKVEEFKISPEGLEHELELAGIRHPGARAGKRELLKVTLNNDKDVLAYANEDGQLVESETGTVLGPDSYKAKEVFKLGTEPKPPADKINEYMDFRTGYLQKHPNATGDEIASAYSKQTARPEHFPIVISPGNIPERVIPGKPVTPGSVTPSGFSQENVPVAATRRMIETAPRVIDLTKKTRELVNQQIATLGPGKSRWADFMSGKVGAPNPEFRKLMSNSILLRSLLINMHIGSGRSATMLQEFKGIIDASKDSPENMLAALDAIESYANDIASQGKSTKEGTGTPTENKKDPLNLFGK